MAEPELCRTCCQPLPDDAPWGLCPACLFGKAIGGEINELPLTEESHSRFAGHKKSPTIPAGKIDDEARPAEFPVFVGRYRLEQEIGRGGMGQVILGLDVEIGREIALKVLHEKYRDSAEMTLRFVEEARIGGRLVHPAIVPVYEMGNFHDGRPFFAMKLVEGRTLADLLNSRSDHTEDLPRYLSIFDQVCQAMAYAHFRRVIHRDLKPLNIMVGAFGEVQTMDWGMAKLLSREGQPAVDNVIRPISAGSGATTFGTIKGTLNYMPPEQARGEVDRLDERADVFSLGAILCEILTGCPPYLGESAEEVLDKAAKADLADALARLDDCGAAAELQALVRHCLAPDQDNRPRDAGKIVALMQSHFVGVQDRLRQAELDRVAAETRAEEESKRRVLADQLAGEAEGRADSDRKRRRLQAGLAAAVVALLTMGGLGAIYYQQQKAAKAVAATRAIGEASMYGDLARSHPEVIAPWRTALAAVKQANGVASGDPEALRQLARLRDELQAGLDAAERDKVLLDRLVDIRSGKADDPDGRETDATYAEAFREAGLDLSVLPPAEAGAWIKARPPSVALAVTAALDDWAIVRRRRCADPAGAGRLAETASLAETDPWRNDLRAALAITDNDHRSGALNSLAETAKFNDRGAVSLDLLGNALADSGDKTTAEAVLRRAQQRYPGDVWVNYDLAQILEQVGRRDDAIRFYTAARVLRPETAHKLAHLLVDGGVTDEAIEVFKDLARRRPGNGRHLGCLGKSLQDRGRPDEAAVVLAQAVTALRERLRLKPNDSLLHLNLCRSLSAQGKIDDAEAECRQAIRLKPDDPDAHNDLGLVLSERRKHDEAISEYRQAIRLKPGDAFAHNNLGIALKSQGKLDAAETECREAIRLKPDFPAAHAILGNVLSGKGKLDEAISEYRQAIRLKSDYALAHYNFGRALGNQGKLDEAISEYRLAVRIKPDYFLAHYSLGIALKSQGKLDEAIAEYREAIRLKPDDAQAHTNLGGTLSDQGKFNEAIAECREAIRHKPDLAEAHTNLGNALCKLRKFDEAISEYREAIRHNPDLAEAHNGLGGALQSQGRFDEAVAELRQALRRSPDSLLVQSNIGHVLLVQGDYAGSLVAYRTAHEIAARNADRRFPTAQWVANAERLAALAERLPALLRGQDYPRDTAERLGLAKLCYDTKRFAAAARFWTEALEADPNLGDDRQTRHRYNAACAAGLASAGQDKGDSPRDEAAKAKLRGQALAWLKAELEAWTRALATGPPQARPAIVRALSHWQQDADLASVRDTQSLAMLPEAERKQWQSFWAEVEALRKRGQETAP